MSVDPYLFALLLGGIGLVAMAVLGLGGRGHVGGLKGHHGPGGGSHAGHGHAPAHGPGSAAHHTAHPQPVTGGRWLFLLSPRVWFTLLVGFGAGGLLTRPFGSSVLQLVAGVAGAVVFEAALVRPLWNLLSRFESRPAAMLEHGVMDEARAVTDFNADGEGLVRLDVDGQVVQLLARLAPADRAAGVRVRTGERLIIETVDTRRQRCTVSAPDADRPVLPTSSPQD